ncbi:MAG TPA: class I SAM-dependent methyltransferase [Steroidobacteraceae bacterium]|jgi:SAM-dependent methyltransferase|nr:class I SAM-dependent methyltransferase [Steroidobacteraceae bacterium]
MDEHELKHCLVDLAGAQYRSSGRFAYHFARGKLSMDPVFTATLVLGLIPDGARILDLGCGQGVLAAWLLAAGQLHTAGTWCPQWPPPPAGWSFRGLEFVLREVERARQAFGERATVELGDIRSVEFGPSDAVVIFDVLHYMAPSAQEAVLRRVRTSLSAGGVLLLRVGDAAGGLPFTFSRWVDQGKLLLMGRGWNKLHCRAIAAWIELLHGLEFRTRAIPMSANTPFANVLLVAHPL